MQLEPIELQSSMGPHSRARRLGQPETDYGGGGSRPFSRVQLVHRTKDSQQRIGFGGGGLGALPAINSHGSSKETRAKRSPYLHHLPTRKRDIYLYSIGSISIDSMDDKSLRLENNLKSQLSKIISPIKAPASIWKNDSGIESTGSDLSSSRYHDKAKKSKGRQQAAQANGMFSLVSLEQDNSEGGDLWGLNYGLQFPPTVNQTVVATPLSDISDFDRDISPGQSASTSSGMYGDFEDEIVQGGSDDYEYIAIEGWK